MSLVQQIIDAANKGSAELKEEDRLALLLASQKLSGALESPPERLLRQLFSPYEPIAIRVAIDLNLFDIAHAKGSPLTADDLAIQSKVEPELITRILRMLVPLDLFTESQTNPITYTLTPLGATYINGSPLREVVLHITYIYPGIANLPEYLESKQYVLPKTSHDTPWNAARNLTGMTLFEHLFSAGNERQAHAFNVSMTMSKTGEESTLVSAYPAAERLRVTDPDRVVFADIGGGLGHQVSKFASMYPDLPGKLILEDLPSVIACAPADLSPRIAKISHSFFSPQPDVLRGAKAFYLRYVLHDWPDAEARVILGHIRDVMASDSVVLLNETVVAEAGMELVQAKMDWHMMQIGALERTERQWRALAESVGLRVREVWWESESVAMRGLIELVKV